MTETGSPIKKGLLPESTRWLLAILLFLLIFNIGTWKILELSENTVNETVKMILEKKLYHDFIRFKEIFDTEILLTHILVESVEKAKNCSSIEKWKEIVSKNLSAELSQSAFSLIIFSDEKTISESDDWDSSILNNFLNFQIARASSFNDVIDAKRFFLNNTKMYRTSGILRLLHFNFIPLPIPPGIYFTSLSKCAQFDHVYKLEEIPKNSFFAFGKIPLPSAEFRYACFFHKDSISQKFLLKRVFKECKNLKIKVKGLNLDEENNSTQSDEVFLQENIPLVGKITFSESLPKGLMNTKLLCFFSNLVLSILILTMAFKFLFRNSWGNIGVQSKIGFVVLISTGFPFYFLSLGVWGKEFDQISTTIHSSFQNMEKEIAQFERDFGTFQNRLQTEYRKAIPGMQRALLNGTGISFSKKILQRLKPQSIDVVSSNSVFLIPSKVQIDWTSWFIRRIPPGKNRQNIFLKRCKEGSLFVPEEMSFLFEGEDEKDSFEKNFKLEEKEPLLNKTSGNGRSQTLGIIASQVINNSNSKLGITPGNKVNKKDLAVELILGEQMCRNFRTQLRNLGRFIEIKNLESDTSHAIFFPEILKDNHGIGQSLFWAMHSYPSIVEDFLSRIISKNVRLGNHKHFVIPLWSSAFAIKDEPGLTGPTSFSNAHLNEGDTGSWFEYNPNGRPYMVCAMLSPKIKDVVISIATPLDEVLESFFSAKLRNEIFGIIFLSSIALIFYILGMIFIRPLGAYKKCLDRNTDSSELALIRPWTLGEFAELTKTFEEFLKYFKELELAKFVQTMLFPKGLVTNDFWQCQGKTVMLSQVGGDFFDLLPLPDGKILFAFGDVSGHGVSAAIVVAMAKSAVILLGKRGLEPHLILSQLNVLFLDLLVKKKMMTMIIGILNPDGSVNFSNAGQTYPVLTSQKFQNSQFLESSSNPLGVVKKAKFSLKTCTLLKNDCLVLYSDGFPEAQNNRKEPFGYENILILFKQLPNQSMHDFLGSVYQNLQNFTGPIPMNDDVTILLLKFSPNKTKELGTTPTSASPLNGSDQINPEVFHEQHE
ncbi:MAG: serine/threonine-protein phosphatase [Candidatus Riflebacteria bacterium]|nr:serine/threonine-protein phosphatase [Candidatus Riflebacteria bacterium]